MHDETEHAPPARPEFLTARQLAAVLQVSETTVRRFLHPTIAAEPVIAFNAGTHQEVIHMPTAEFRRLTNAVTVPLIRERAMRAW